MSQTRARVPDDARISFEVGTQRPEETSYLSVEPFEMLWVVTNGVSRRNLFRIKLNKTGLYVSLSRDGNIHSSYHSDGNCHWKSAYHETIELPTRPTLQEITKPQLIGNGTIAITDDVLNAFELTEFEDKAVDRVVYLDNRKLPPTIAYEVWAVPPFKHAEVALRTDFPAHIHVVTHTVPWIEVVVYEQGLPR
jgi:hypothetical protein